MTILLTGGSGKTASRVANILRAQSVPYLVASRKGTAPNSPAVRFDWSDPSTFSNPFDHPTCKKSPITAIYILVPDELNDPVGTANSFIDLSREHGVRRFVLLSASPVPEGGPFAGKVHEHIRRTCPEWAVLRPTWFQGTND